MERVKVVQMQVGAYADDYKSRFGLDISSFTWVDTGHPSLEAAQANWPSYTYREVYVTVDGNEFGELSHIEPPVSSSKFVVEMQLPCSGSWLRSSTLPDKYDSKREAWAAINSLENSVTYRVVPTSSSNHEYVEGAD